MRKETREAMEMLFRARWNLVKAANHAGLTLKETKLAFAGWCESHPCIYNKTGQLIGEAVQQELQVWSKQAE